MTEEELNHHKKLIFCGKPCYADTEPCEYKYLDGYNELVHMYRNGIYTRDECIKLARKLKAEYEDYCHKYKTAEKIYKTYQDNIKKVDDLRIKINKSDNMTDMLEAALKAIGILTGDDVFEKYNLDKKGSDIL